MKKIVTVFLFSFIVFSVHTAETLLSAEYQYGLSFSKGEDVATFTSPEKKRFAIGEQRINVKTYTFWNNQNIGLFTQTGVLLPYFTKTNDKDDSYIEDGGIPLSFELGVGFRHILSEHSAILYSAGAGFDFGMYFYKYRLSPTATDIQEHRRKIAFRLLSDIGYKYNISNNVYINCGSNFKFAFAQHLKIATKLTSNDDFISNTKWAKGFFSFEFFPYIGIGFVVNSKS